MSIKLYSIISFLAKKRIKLWEKSLFSFVCPTSAYMLLTYVLMSPVGIVITSPLRICRWQMLSSGGGNLASWAVWYNVKWNKSSSKRCFHLPADHRSQSQRSPTGPVSIGSCLEVMKVKGTRLCAKRMSILSPHTRIEIFVWGILA